MCGAGWQLRATVRIQQPLYAMPGTSLHTTDKCFISLTDSGWPS